MGLADRAEAGGPGRGLAAPAAPLTFGAGAAAGAAERRELRPPPPRLEGSPSTIRIAE